MAVVMPPADGYLGPDRADRVRDDIRRSAGWALGLGLGIALVGIVALLLPAAAGLAVGVLVGLALLVKGAAELVHAFRGLEGSDRWWWAVAGGLAVLTGLAMLAFPALGLAALTLAVAAYFLAEGVIKLVLAFQLGSRPGWGWLVFNGVAALALALVIGLSWPTSSLWAIGILVGINLIFAGAALASMGLAVRSTV